MKYNLWNSILTDTYSYNQHSLCAFCSSTATISIITGYCYNTYRWRCNHMCSMYVCMYVCTYVCGSFLFCGYVRGMMDSCIWNQIIASRWTIKKWYTCALFSRQLSPCTQWTLLNEIWWNYEGNNGWWLQCLNFLHSTFSPVKWTLKLE